MSTAPSSRRAPARRRDELLEAAERLLIAQGVARTTVDEIAAAAGVAKGTFYLYFASKDAAIDALREKFTADVARELEAIVSPAERSGWRACTEQLVRRAIDFQVRNADLHRIVVESPHPHGHGELDALRRVTGALRSIIEAGVADGAYRVEDSGATAWLVLDVLHAAGARAAGPERERVTAATVEAVGRMLGLSERA